MKNYIIVFRSSSRETRITDLRHFPPLTSDGDKKGSEGGRDADTIHYRVCALRVLGSSLYMYFGDCVPVRGHTFFYSDFL